MFRAGGTGALAVARRSTLRFAGALPYISGGLPDRTGTRAMDRRNEIVGNHRPGEAEYNRPAAANAPAASKSAAIDTAKAAR